MAGHHRQGSVAALVNALDLPLATATRPCWPSMRVISGHQEGSLPSSLFACQWNLQVGWPVGFRLEAAPIDARGSEEGYRFRP